MQQPLYDTMPVKITLNTNGLILALYFSVTFRRLKLSSPLNLVDWWGKSSKTHLQTSQSHTSRYSKHYFNKDSGCLNSTLLVFNSDCTFCGSFERECQ